MKSLSKFCFVFFVCSSLALAAESEPKSKWSWGAIQCHDNISIDFQDGSLLAYDDLTDELLFEITAEYQLYVNGELVKTMVSQEDLLREYYEQAEDIREEAWKIGYKGASIGVESAKIALTAVGGVFEMLFSGFDDSVVNEFEYQIEQEAEGIEAEAERLEEKAEVIEEMVDELDVMFDELQEEIPELGDLE